MGVRFLIILLLFPLTHFGQYCEDFNFELMDDALSVGGRSVHRDRSGAESLYVTDGTGYMKVIDCTDAENLAYIGNLVLFDWWEVEEYLLNKITQRDEYLYFATGDIYPPYVQPAGLVIESKLADDPPFDFYQQDVWFSGNTVAGGASSVSLKGDLVYLCTSGSGLILLDVSDPTNIDSVTSFLPEINFPIGVDPEKVNAKDIILEDSRAYLANDAGGIRILDISNPLSITEIGQYSNPALEGITHNYLNLVKHENYLYATTGTCGLEVLDVSDADNITLVHWWNPWNCAETDPISSRGYLNEIEINTDCNYIFVSAGRSEFYAFNIFHRAAPELCEHYGATDNGQTAYGLSVFEDNVYLGYVPEDDDLPVYGGEPAIKAFTYNTECGVGIQKVERENWIEIYPNPAQDILNISVASENFIDQVIIYNLIGEVVLFDDSGNNTLSVANLNSGSYILRVQVDGEEFNTLFVVE